MNVQLLKDSLGWGFVLWLVGYILGIIFFMLLPAHLIGFFILPIGTILTLWVLRKKIQNKQLSYLLKISIVWTLIAIIFDYLFIVKAFKSSDYYKPDIYLYYLLTFSLPLFVAWRHKTQSQT